MGKVRPRGAVLSQVFGQDQAQVMLAGNQQPAQPVRLTSHSPSPPSQPTHLDIASVASQF